MTGLELVGFGAALPGAAALLDGTESDGTNLLPGGTAAFTSGWTTLGTTLTANNNTSPAGTTTAAQMLEAATTARHGIYTNPSIVAGSSHDYSVYAKSVTRRYLQLVMTETGKIVVYFDLQSGTVTDNQIITTSGVTSRGAPTIQAAVNGFWKCTVPSVVVDSFTASPYWQLMASDVATYGAPLDSDSPSFAGDTSNGLLLWRPKVV